MDQQANQPNEPDAPSTTRSQNVVYTLAHDWSVIPQFLAPALERLDRNAGETQLLVVTGDGETALAMAETALLLRDDPGTRPLLVPVTRPERVTRLLRAGASPAIAGTPAALATLIRAAALKLDGVRTLVLAWADDAADAASAADLEAVLAEVPKDAARILVAAEPTDAVEALIERYLRRPRRVGGAASAPAATPRPVTIAYVPVAPTARPAALRRLLDEMDPPSAAVVVASDATATEAARVLRGLGYHAPSGGGAESDAASAFGPNIRVARGAAPNDVALAVLYDVPPDRAALDRIVAGRPAQIVALVQPRQLDALRALAGGPITPLALPDHAHRARAHDERLRAELRAALVAGVPHRELLAIEPLLDEFDGVQIAAAAVRLLEQARAAAVAAPSVAATAAAPPERGAGGDASGVTRLFITVGGKDGVRPGDLVGAITGEAGIASDRIGKIEVRDAFSLVEIASADAPRVIAKVNGIAIGGRRVTVRMEREQRGDSGGRGDARGEARGGDARGERRGPRPERGDRRPPAGDQRGGEGRPPARGGPRSFDTRDGPRGFGAPDDRGVSERAEQRGEWAERGARMRNARRDRTPDAGGEASADADADAGHVRRESTTPESDES